MAGQGSLHVRRGLKCYCYTQCQCRYCWLYYARSSRATR